MTGEPSRLVERGGAGSDPVDVTLATYEARAEEYAARNRGPYPPVVAFLDRLAELLAGASVLELGSGPGRDADHLEAKGVRVIRTDGASSFVEMMRSNGHEAHLLDLRTGDFGGPHDAVLADAVLLHLRREQLERVLERLRAAIREGGVLAFTVKEGSGSAWSEEKLGQPRYFVYWQEPALRETLERTGWSVISIEYSVGPADRWLQVMAR